MPFVLDASIVVVWGFTDEDDAYADRTLELLAAEEEAVVPAIRPLEVANTILTSERRGCLSAAGTARFLGLPDGLPITVENAALRNAP